MKDTEKQRERSQMSNITSQAFGDWWKLYPRRVAKRDAEKKFTRLIKTAWDYSTLCENTSAWASYWESTDTQFIPYPSTYLNRGQWEDPPPVNGKARIGRSAMDEMEGL